jgi:ATP-dependent DNA ligase
VDDQGRAVFDRLQNGPRIKPEAILFAFDLLELDDKDLRREPLQSRKATLLSLLKAAPHGILYNEGDGARFSATPASWAARESSASAPTRRPIAAQKVRSENWNR